MRRTAVTSSMKVLKDAAGVVACGGVGGPAPAPVGWCDHFGRATARGRHHLNLLRVVVDGQRCERVVIACRSSVCVVEHASGELVTPRLDVILEQLHLKVGLLFQILEQA